MKQSKMTKRSLLASVLALLLCVSMLIGSTFAWFTDSVTSAGNKIQAGELKIDLQVLNNGKYESVKDSKDPIFNYDKWEPGFTQVETLKIVNTGNLALKYQLDVFAEDSDSILADVIDVYMCFGESTAKSAADLADTTKWWKCGTLAEMMAKPEGFTQGKLLPVGAQYDGEQLGQNGVAIGEITASIALHMQESAGNEYQGLDLGNVDIRLFATQYTFEEDSFDDQYDADADFVAYYNKAGKYEVNTTLLATKATDVITADGKDVVVNITGGYYDAGDQECAVWAKNGAEVNIYGGEFIHNGDDEAATSANHFDMIYAGTEGKINIYGGTFSARSEGVWLLNAKDNQGKIEVYGGSFLNWNPADNVSEGANTNFLADGYTVTKETKANGDVWYHVVKTVKTFDELQNAMNKGETVALGNDIDAKTVTLNIPEGIKAAIELNGYTFTSKDGGGSNTMAIKINRDAELTVNDSVGTGEIVSSCYGVYVLPNAKFIMNGGTLTVSGNGTYDYGVVVWNGEFVMNAGNIKAHIGVYMTDYYRNTAADANAPDCKVTIADDCEIEAVATTGDYAEIAGIHVFNHKDSSDPNHITKDAVVTVPENVNVYTTWNEIAA